LGSDSGNKAHVLNLVTHQLEASYTLPGHPGAIALITDTNIAVIASRESDSLSLIDLTTNALTAGFTVSCPRVRRVNLRRESADFPEFPASIGTNKLWIAVNRHRIFSVLPSTPRTSSATAGS